MGNVFSAPKPPKIQAVTYAPSQASSSGNGSSVPDSTSPSTATTDALGDVENRRGRGQSGTVLTSWQGVLQPNDFIPKRHSLLGE